jgi:amidohydrolase
MTIIEQADAIREKLTEIREDLHKHPELSFQEERTSRRIVEIMRDLGLDEIREGIAKTGVVGLLHGGKPGKTIAMRADIDALPIQEENDVPYKSQNDGVMHACGHDVHITSVLGAAMILSKMRDEISGNVKFLFQPAEEIGGGAKAMVQDGVLESPPKIDAIIALHAWPDADVGTIGAKAGPAMAAMDKFEIIVRGPGGHGAMPHLTSDPIVAAAQIINSLQTVVSRSIEPIQPIVFSVCMIHGGHAFNIIPREVKMVGTARTLSEDVRAKAIERVKDILRGIGIAMDVECEFKYTDGCPPVINDSGMIDIIKQASSEIFGSENVLRIEPTMGGEDFTYFSRLVPGAMFRLGTREEKSGYTSPLHRPTFDVGPRALSTGAAILSAAALKYLNE